MKTQYFGRITKTFNKQGQQFSKDEIILVSRLAKNEFHIETEGGLRRTNLPRFIAERNISMFRIDGNMVPVIVGKNIHIQIDELEAAVNKQQKVA